MLGQMERCLGVVIGDDAENAEIAGVGDGEGAQTDSRLGEDAERIRQSAFAVFYKYGYLSDCHKSISFHFLGVLVRLPVFRFGGTMTHSSSRQAQPIAMP